MRRAFLRQLALARRFMRWWVLSQPVERRAPPLLILPTLQGRPRQSWHNHDHFYTLQDELSRTFCHNDLFHRNTILRGGKRPRCVAIDDDGRKLGHSRRGGFQRSMQRNPVFGGLRCLLVVSRRGLVVGRSRWLDSSSWSCWLAGCRCGWPAARSASAARFNTSSHRISQRRAWGLIGAPPRSVWGLAVIGMSDRTSTAEHRQM